MTFDLSEKSISVESVAKEALNDKKALLKLFEGILSKKDTIRYNSFKILLLISDDHPEVLYPRWDLFADLIDSDNTCLRFIAVRIMANLTRADKEKKFEKIFDKFYDLFNDSVIVAGHLAASLGKIAKAKPKLQTRITNKLLNVDKISQKHKDLVKAGAIESFDEYFEEAKNKKKILEFVKKQLNCKSPKTRKKAKEFLNKRD